MPGIEKEMYVTRVLIIFSIISALVSFIPTAEEKNARCDHVRRRIIYGS